MGIILPTSAVTPLPGPVLIHPKLTNSYATDCEPQARARASLPGAARRTRGSHLVYGDIPGRNQGTIPLGQKKDLERPMTAPDNALDMNLGYFASLATACELLRCVRILLAGASPISEPRAVRVIPRRLKSSE